MDNETTGQTPTMQTSPAIHEAVATHGASTELLVDELLVDQLLVDQLLVDELLVEEISIDGMCGVY